MSNKLKELVNWKFSF